MEPTRSARPAPELSSEDVVEKGGHQLGVHIIYVPTSLIVQELQFEPARGVVGAAELTQVQKHLGANTRPTDIVVFAGEPWHLAGPPGQLRLRRHPQVHIDYKETVLVLPQHKQAVWWSETDFAITLVKPNGGHHLNPHYPEALSPPAPPTPDDPFIGPLTRSVKSVHGVDVYVWTSTPPKPDAREHMYKIAFTIGGGPIDPDMYCAP